MRTSGFRTRHGATLAVIFRVLLAVFQALKYCGKFAPRHFGRRSHNLKVVGSNPTPATKFIDEISMTYRGMRRQHDVLLLLQGLTRRSPKIPKAYKYSPFFRATWMRHGGRHVSCQKVHVYSCATPKAALIAPNSFSARAAVTFGRSATLLKSSNRRRISAMTRRLSSRLCP